MKIICQVLKEQRAKIVRFGSPSVSMGPSSSLSTPPPSSMSYVASCSFLSLSDCNVIKKTTTKKNTLFDVNIKTNSSSSSSNNKNKNSSISKNETKPKGQFPSSIDQLRPMMLKNTAINGEKKTDEMNSVVIPMSKVRLRPISYTGANAKAA